MADLHIGKIVLEQSMLEDQKYMLNQIIENIKNEKVEVVLISGDIYDRSVPPADAVNVLDNFLKILVKELKLKVFIIAGNHDSKERLNFGSKIFMDDGLFICAEYRGQMEKVELEDEYGKLNVYMLPYIKPVEVKQYFEDMEIDSYHEAVKAIIDRENINEKERNIIVSHQFVTAGNEEPETSDSEVKLLGGTENVDVSVYEKFDYVALGHIHRPQQIGRETARYAGTMLKYSFSEVNHKKMLTILEFKGKNEKISMNFIHLVPLKDMREIKGPIEELLNPDNYMGTNREDYIRVIITNENPVYDAIGQVKKVYPNVLRLDIQNSRTQISENVNITDIDNIKKKDEVELFNEFYMSQNNVELNERQLEIMKKVVSEVKKL